MALPRSILLFFLLVAATWAKRKEPAPATVVENNTRWWSKSKEPPPANVVENSTKSWSSWYDYLEPPSNDEIRSRFGNRRKIAEKDFLTKKREFDLSVKEYKDSYHKKVRKQKRLFRRAVEKRFFKQRFGWERARHAARDYVGLAIGATVAFTGYTNPHLKNGGSLALQAGQIGWEFSLFNYPNEPWVRDVSSGAIGIVAAKALPPTIATSIPPIYLSLAMFRTVNNVMEDILYGQNAFAVAAVSGLASLAMIVAATHHGIPLALASASISGARLMFDSIAAEVAGNWVMMLKLAMPVARKAVWLAFRLLKILWTPFKWLIRLIRYLWTKLASVTPSPVKKVGRRIAWRSVVTYRALRSFEKRVGNYPPVLSFRHFLSKVKHAIKHNRPVILPWAIASTGIARQMGYANSLREMFAIFKLILDPIRVYKKLPKKELKRMLKSGYVRMVEAIAGILRSRAKED